MAGLSSLLKMKNIEGKGRGLFAAQPLKAGQVVLRESPLIIYSAFPLIPPSSPYCDHCFRILPPSNTVVPCPSCSHHHFCSHKCLSNALKSTHSSWVCQVFSHLRDSTLIEQPYELQLQARFLVAAYNLVIMSPSDLHILLSLPGTPDDSILDAAQFLHSLISPLFPPHNNFSVDLTTKLVAKRKFSSLWLMDPYSPNDPQRFIKAYAIYPKATMFNHDCIPNSCRFDYLNTNDDHNTDLFIRLIQDVPEGKEICTSYVGLNLDYSTRKRELETFGFTCGCDRCKVESNRLNDHQHMHFLSKYVCDRKNCEGPLAPLAPKDDAPSHVLECSSCGNLKLDVAKQDFKSGSAVIIEAATLRISEFSQQYDNYNYDHIITKKLEM